ncbi:MAG: NrsF family protein [Pseudomonadota bacterium]
MKPSPDTDPLADLPWPKAAPSPECSATICRECTANLTPRRGMTGTQRLLASLAVSAGTLGVLLFATRDGIRHEGTFQAALIGAAGWGIVQAAVLWMGLARPPGCRPSASVRLVTAVLVPVLFLGYLVLLAPEWATLGEATGPAQLSRTLDCGLVGLLTSALVSGGVLLLWRGTDPLTPGLTGALAGLVGGIGGGVAISAACPTQEGFHACAAHGFGVILFVVFGWAVGKRLLAP